ncbi:MAG: serine O-acetyltransferase [Oscillospiraceae bacterium]|nr:serine O-acetyltransferase [Oscillospiraceae bacterium]
MSTNPGYFYLLKEDLMCIKARDPAAASLFEIFLLYPGLKAVRAHRLAYALHSRGFSFAARFISQRCAKKTNIEIHPAATIGRRFFIDHGTGVVIGETAEIGDDVTIYQGVTLGGTGKDVGKRHPTIGNHVMIGAGAKILGPFKIGDNTNIAAGSVVLNEIPENCTAVGSPARVVKQNGIRVDYLDQINVPDPIMHEMKRLEDEIKELKEEIKKLKEEKNESI